jgi:hypothetical protein
MAATTREESRVKELATTIVSWPQDQLLHPKNAGSLNFEDIKPTFDAIQGFYREVLEAQFNWVPPNILNELVRVEEGIIQVFTQVQDFSFNIDQPNQMRISTAGRVGNQWVEAVKITAPYVPLGHVTSGAVSKAMAEFKAAYGQLVLDGGKEAADYKEKVAAAEQMLKAQKDELEKAMSAARDAAKYQAVTAQSKAFGDEADEALKESKFWMKATVGSVVFSLIVIWFVFLKNLHPAVTDANSALGTKPIATASNQPSSTVSAAPAPANDVLESKTITASLLQQTVARILIVTMLYSAVVWCARNYFASKHNVTVNRHRRNAMNTFRAFVEGTKDPATQDFILRQAAACAFSPQQSGYLKDESLPTPGPASQLVEMIKPGGKAD